MPDITPLSDILRCSRCPATIRSAHLPESGWVIIAGKPYCPADAAARSRRDGIDQSDSAAPDVELQDLSERTWSKFDDTLDMEPSGEHEL